jgi:hypothetical protein
MLGIAADGMGAVVDGSGASRGFFGASSALSFMDAVRSAILGISATQPVTRPGSPDPTGSRRYRALLPEADLYVLPSRAICNFLVESFFTASHTVFPILHQPSFKREYEAHFASGAGRDHQWQSLLNIVLASGANFADRLPMGCESAELLFQRSRQLIGPDLLDGGNMRVCQILILFGQVRRPRARTSVTSIPQTVRASDKRHFESVERRRPWHAYGSQSRLPSPTSQSPDRPHLDRGEEARLVRRRPPRYVRSSALDARGRTLTKARSVLAMSYGRPPMAVSIATTVERPLPVDDERITHDGVRPQPLGTPSHNACFNATIPLYAILADVLRALYQPQSTDESVPSAAPTSMLDVMALEQRLQGWRESLPAYFRFGGAHDDPAMPLDLWLQRQRNILHHRWLHVRILLFRPSLARSLSAIEHAASDGLLEQLSKATAGMCVEAATEQIELCQRATKRVETQGAPWCVYCADPSTRLTRSSRYTVLCASR